MQKMIATIVLAFLSVLLWGCAGHGLLEPTANQTDWQSISNDQLVWPLFVPRGKQDLVRLTDIKVTFTGLGSNSATAQLSIGGKYPFCPLLNRNAQRPMLVLVLETSTQPGLHVPVGELPEGGGAQTDIVKAPVAIGPGIPTRGYLAFQGYCD
jgi:hypothetical protein